MTVPGTACTSGRPARSPSARASACERTADPRSGARIRSGACKKVAVFFSSVSEKFEGRSAAGRMTFLPDAGKNIKIPSRQILFHSSSGITRLCYSL